MRARFLLLTASCAADRASTAARSTSLFAGMLGKASINADGGGNAGPSVRGRYNAMNVPRCCMRSAAIGLTRFGSGASTVSSSALGRRATDCCREPADVVVVGLWFANLYRFSSSLINSGLSVCSSNLWRMNDCVGLYPGHFVPRRTQMLHSGFASSHLTFL